MNKLSVIDGETLLDMDLNAPRFCVQNFLPQGLSILGGAPKMEKSWLVMDLCVRIAKGEAMWNIETTKGTTLYLCLEDPYFRIQQRLGCITDEAPPNVFFANAAMRQCGNAAMRQCGNAASRASGCPPAAPLTLKGKPGGCPDPLNKPRNGGIE